jgi:fructokinase
MRVGIDLGGTKTEVIALDENGATLLRRRVPTPTGDYVGIVHAIVDLVLSVERELDRQGTVGVASPGAISTRTGFLKNSNSTVLNGKPLDRDLSERLVHRFDEIDHMGVGFIFAETTCSLTA